MKACKRLKHERFYQDLTQKKLEKMIGAAPGTIEKIENGDIQELHRYQRSIELALGVSHNFLQEKE